MGDCIKNGDVVRAVGEVEVEVIRTIADELPAERIGVETTRLFHIDAADGEVAEESHGWKH